MEVAGKDLSREDGWSKENRNEATKLKFSCVHGGDNGGALRVLVKIGDRVLLLGRKL